MEQSDIQSMFDHGSEWTVTVVGGEQMVVPQDTRNKDARVCLQWIDAGGQVQSAEKGARRQARQRLKEDPLLRGLSRTLAQKFGMTPAEFREEWISNVPVNSQ